MLLRYAVAISLLAFFLNINHLAEKCAKADEFIEHVKGRRSIGMSKVYFELCRPNLIDYFDKSRALRRENLDDLGQYTHAIFYSLGFKEAVLYHCVEKIYTMSSDTQGQDFQEVKNGFIYLNKKSDYFTKQFEKLYDTMSTAEELSEERVKEIFYFMIDELKNGDFSGIKYNGETPTEQVIKMVKKLYITDKTFVEFKIEDENIMKAKVLQEVPELQMMFRDIVKLLEK